MGGRYITLYLLEKEGWSAVGLCRCPQRKVVLVPGPNRVGRVAPEVRFELYRCPEHRQRCVLGSIQDTDQTVALVLPEGRREHRKIKETLNPLLSRAPTRVLCR